jgi:hypothetical protein
MLPTRRLDLEMGVFDFICRPDGSLVWLELNTQRQFLFGEGKAQFDIVNSFCDFLFDRAFQSMERPLVKTIVA